MKRSALIRSINKEIATYEGREERAIAKKNKEMSQKALDDLQQKMNQ